MVEIEIFTNYFVYYNNHQIVNKTFSEDLAEEFLLYKSRLIILFVHVFDVFDIIVIIAIVVIVVIVVIVFIVIVFIIGIIVIVVIGWLVGLWWVMVGGGE